MVCRPVPIKKVEELMTTSSEGWELVAIEFELTVVELLHIVVPDPVEEPAPLDWEEMAVPPEPVLLPPRGGLDDVQAVVVPQSTSVVVYIVVVLWFLIVVVMVISVTLDDD